MKQPLVVVLCVTSGVLFVSENMAPRFSSRGVGNLRYACMLHAALDAGEPM